MLAKRYNGKSLRNLMRIYDKANLLICLRRFSNKKLRSYLWHSFSFSERKSTGGRGGI